IWPGVRLTALAASWTHTSYLATPARDTQLRLGRRVVAGSIGLIDVLMVKSMPGPHQPVVLPRGGAKALAQMREVWPGGRLLGGVQELPVSGWLGKRSVWPVVRSLS